MSPTVLAIVSRGSDPKVACGTENGGKELVTKLTHPEVNKWIVKFAAIDS